jgi:peptide/nickel transport system permease protein
MLRYVRSIALRLFSTIATALLVALASFSIIYFSPGNPAEILLRTKNPTGAVSARAIGDYTAALGLDKGYAAMFLDWLKGLAGGDLGISLKTGLPVLQEFADRIGCTLALTALSAAIALALGLTFGVLSALYHNRIFDRLIRFFVVFNMSVPSFWLALLFLWLFSIRLHLFPTFGFDGVKNLILPSAVMGLGNAGTLIQVAKACLQENMGSPYVLTARAKGLSEGEILVLHVMKNVMLPVITMCGMNLAEMLGGSVIIESIFGLPGIGNYLVKSIGFKDYSVIMGFVFLMGAMIVLINLTVDLLYRVIDPRVRQAIHEK